MNTPSAKPFFSIVIPTRNEELDILKTLKSICENSEEDFEVLVVDASSDKTPQAVQNFGDQRVRLLPQSNRDGRCGARNQGIQEARGEVVVILNADVRMENHFLEKLRRHYEGPVDYVVVDARVENLAHPFGAMVEAEHHYLYKSGREIENWCEGYSCRREAALKAGLFPSGFVVPICAGEDAVFADNVAKSARRKEDFSLVVEHAIPEDFATFWSQRIGRGQGCSQRRILLDGWSIEKTFRDGRWWTIKSFFWIALLFPMVRYAFRLAPHSPKVGPLRLIWPIFLHRLAHEIGRWKGYRQVCRGLRKKSAG